MVHVLVVMSARSHHRALAAHRRAAVVQAAHHHGSADAADAANGAARRCGRRIVGARHRGGGRRVPVGRLRHLAARRQIAIAARHLAEADAARIHAGRHGRRLQAAGVERGGGRLVQVGVIHGGDGGGGQLEVDTWHAHTSMSMSVRVCFGSADALDVTQTYLRTVHPPKQQSAHRHLVGFIIRYTSPADTRRTAQKSLGAMRVCHTLPDTGDRSSFGRTLARSCRKTRPDRPVAYPEIK